MATPHVDAGPGRLWGIALWLCLIGTCVPIGLMSLMGIAAPTAESLLPFTGVSVGFAVAGLVLCGLGLRSKRSGLAMLFAVFLLLPGGLSMLVLVDGLKGRSHNADLYVCGVAEREGRTVPRGEPGYKARRDQDGDGLACEPVLGPDCHEGRCAPFG